MSDTQKAARFNITLPPDLRARMEAAPSVNWSAVAAEAFQRHLLQIESRKEVENVEDVIARLKAAEEVDSSEAHARGERAGDQWARSKARPRQLRALAREFEGGEGHPFDGYRDSYGILTSLYAVLDSRQHDSDLDHRDAKAFWERAGVSFEDIDDWDFADGFVDGALALWDKVQSEI